MKSGTIQVRYRNRLHRGMRRSFWSAPTRVTGKKDRKAPLVLDALEIRAAARNLRELVLWDLREEGYTFREIGELFGMTKQRASQLERKMIIRAGARANQGLRGASRQQPKSLFNGPRNWLRAITKEEFEGQLAKINQLYQQQFIRVVQRSYRRKHLPDRPDSAGSVSEFWRVWPFIETYQRQPFSYSRLISDFPHLSDVPHLAQFLSRLRRTGLLRTVGASKTPGHNLPEVLMAEAPIEQHADAAIERLVSRWSDQLGRLQRTRRPYRPSRSLEVTRLYLIERFLEEGIPRSEIEEVFPSPRTANSVSLQELTRSGQQLKVDTIPRGASAPHRPA